MFPSTHTCWKWKGLSIFKGCWCFYGDEDDDNDDDDDDDDDDDIKQMMTVPISKEYTLEQVLRTIKAILNGVAYQKEPQKMLHGRR